MVNSLTLSLVAFACIFGGALIGMALRTLLPDHHLSEESKDVVKLGTGMIATLAALVLALLLTSAKGTFDTTTNELKQTASRLVLLDRVMAQYGTETREVRDLLRRVIASAIQRYWPEESHEAAISTADQSGYDFETIQDKLRQLTPHNDSQRWLKSRALQVSGDIVEARWLIQGQVGQSSLPAPFLVVLICWLTAIFASFGLYSPRNGTVIFVMLVCAISVAAALFLILEMDRPYYGLIKFSSAPLHKALVVMGP